mmetsp:Transcript_9592/g.27367  ORF Transcript_9592/g.27367 Transcript_9592/m.27367 type:complete len:125 (+) Transcript_9592:310-684(+)
MTSTRRAFRLTWRRPGRKPWISMSPTLRGGRPQPSQRAPPPPQKKQQTMTEKAKADDDSNLEDTDESDMSSSSADDYMPTPESAVPEHELPTSGSESSLGDDFLIRSAKAQKQAEDVIKRHQEA